MRKWKTTDWSGFESEATRGGGTKVERQVKEENRANNSIERRGDRKISRQVEFDLKRVAPDNVHLSEVVVGETR